MLNTVLCCCSVPSHIQLFTVPWTAARQASLYPTISWSLPKFMSIESVMPSNHLVLCCPFLLLPSVFPSIKGFSNEVGCCIRWPKYWHFSFSISPSSEYSGLISFRIDWFYLLTVKGFSRVFASTTVWKHSSLSYTVNPCCLSILCVVICFCLSHTPNLSLPPPFPFGKHVCFMSVSLFIFCILINLY